MKRCPSCFFRVTSKDERCPDVRCVRYEFEREAESSEEHNEEPEGNEVVDEQVFVFDSSEEYNSSDDPSFNM